MFLVESVGAVHVVDRGGYCELGCVSCPDRLPVGECLFVSGICSYMRAQRVC